MLRHVEWTGGSVMGRQQLFNAPLQIRIACASLMEETGPLIKRSAPHGFKNLFLALDLRRHTVTHLQARYIRAGQSAMTYIISRKLTALTSGQRACHERLPGRMIEPNQMSQLMHHCGEQVHAVVGVC
jgi:hypothetical protein